MTNNSTRIPRCEVVGPYEAIFAENPDLPAFGARVLGLFQRVRLTLTYLRHNPCQELLAELYGVSQPTASRVIAAYTPPIAAALNSNVPTVEDLDPEAQLIAEGTLLECWSWADHPELYSGKHRTTGVECPGCLYPVRDPGLGVRPQDGRTHDVEALRRSGLLDVPDGAPPPQHIGDKVYPLVIGAPSAVSFLPGAAAVAPCSCGAALGP